MSKKKILIIGVLVVALAITGGACWWFGYEVPHREALVRTSTKLTATQQNEFT